MWFSGRLGFHHHCHYLNSYTGFQFLIGLILSCQLLHIVLYLHNNHPTWLVSCIFQISIGISDHKFHNLLCLKQNLAWVNVISLSLHLGSGINSPITLKLLKLYLFSEKNSRHVYSKLHFHHKSVMLTDSVLLRL